MTEIKAHKLATNKYLPLFLFNNAPQISWNSAIQSTISQRLWVVSIHTCQIIKVLNVAKVIPLEDHQSQTVISTLHNLPQGYHSHLTQTTIAYIRLLVREKTAHPR